MAMIKYQPMNQKYFYSWLAHICQSLFLVTCLALLSACGSSEDAMTEANTPAPDKSFKNYIHPCTRSSMQTNSSLPM